jgi:hypothetical protein
VSLLRELKFSHRELLLSEAGTGGTGLFREARVREKSAVGSRYQAITGEDTADLEDFVSVCCSELQSV